MIVPVSKSHIMAQVPDQADVWLLEPIEKTDNQSCFNMSINRDLENLHIEILGEGFDVSDLNKGAISPHEIMDMPFPFINGYYNEWWKWAKIHICSMEEYENSIRIRKSRLKQYGKEITFPERFTPIRLELLDKIRTYLQLIEPWIIETNLRFVNISCSILKSGRFIFWDIQTPEGKYIAYMK